MAIIKANKSKKGMLWRRECSTIDFNSRLVFLQSAYTKMINHCIKDKPLEACGLLSGKKKMVQTCWPMVNILHSQNEFEIDIQQIQVGFHKMKEKGEQLVGIYHSHPTTPPYPSPNDIIYADYPEESYVIISLCKTIPEVRCFHIIDRQVYPIHHEIHSTD